jgi:hypothetical protein
MTSDLDALRSIAQDEELSPDDQAQLRAVLRTLDSVPELRDPRLSPLVACAERVRRGTSSGVDLQISAALVLRAIALATTPIPDQHEGVSRSPEGTP